jgi:hypothetical protein
VDAVAVTPLRVRLGDASRPRLRWSRPTDEPQLRDGADPLGFRAVANRMARRIAPGLTQSTTSVRAFGLLTVGLDLAAGSDDPNETFQRFERLWVLATEAAGQAGAPVDRYAGSRRALRLLNGDSDTLDLTRPILDRQLTTGLWGAYRRSAVHFRLLAPHARSATRPSAHGLTAAGHAVRTATWDEVRQGQAQFRHWLKVGRVERSAPTDWLLPGTGCSAAEAKALSIAVRKVDDEAGRPLGRLREQFGHSGRLALDRLHLGTLSVDQAEAVRVARAVDTLMEAVEAPFRSWIAGGASPTPAQLRRVAALDEWDLVVRDGEARLDHLRAALNDRPHVESVLDHHTWLCAQRGARPWTQGDPSKAESEPADFGLGAPRLLFTEGLLG